jgi:hypothetical protein
MLALNFADYLSFENRVALHWTTLDQNARAFVHSLEQLGTPVCYLGTGPHLADNIRLGPKPTGPDLTGAPPALKLSHFEGRQ